VKTKLSKLLFTAGLCMLFLALMTSAVFAQGEMNTYRGGLKDSSYFNGMVAPIGSIIDIYDQDGTFFDCDTIAESPGAGRYGDIIVEDNDAITPGEILTFKLNGRVAETTGPDEPIWDGLAWPPKEVNLSVEGADVAANFTTPGDQMAFAGDVVHYMVMVENTGDGLDFYTATATSGAGWLIEYNEGFHYAEMGETITIQFDLRIPPGVMATTDQIEFTVTSVLDNSVTVSGNVLTTVSEPTDIDSDGNSSLPGDFKLYQNYPNPFNPATTISYDLPSSSVVNLFVYDLLGREVREFNFGIKSAGNHSFTFDAESLSSGVYFYKIETETSSAMKRMLLLK